MQVSQARIEANRRNAQLSTGPKSAEGKARSRANALKHGLCATVVEPESVEAIQERASSMYHALKPQNQYHAWLVNQVAVISLRIDRAGRMERRVRDKIAVRAELSWDDDRRLEAETLGNQIGRYPSQVVEKLKRTLHGCDWMIARWAMLAHAAVANPGWTPEQVGLAFDLLGTPSMFRKGRNPGAMLDDDGLVIEATDDPAAVARRQIGLLKERREIAKDLDEIERTLTEVDLGDDGDPELRRLRRYESSLHAKLRWCVAQVHFKPPHDHARAEFLPNWHNVHAPSEGEGEAADAPPPSAKATHPPFDLEPDECPEPGQPVDIPAILSARRQKQVRKSESRRDARRRKVERLRA